MRNFWNKITKKFFFPTVCIFDFVKIWTLVFRFYFWLINLWRKWWTYVLRINVMTVFQVSLIFDAVKKMLIIRCEIYILMKKIIILRKIQFNGSFPLDNCLPDKFPPMKFSPGQFPYRQLTLNNPPWATVLLAIVPHEILPSTIYPRTFTPQTIAPE